VLDKNLYVGTWVAPVTPIGEDNELILDCLHTQYTHLAKSEITAMIPFSPVGEFPSLLFQEKVEYLRALGQEAGQMKIFPQIGNTSLKEMLKLALVAESSGVDGIAIIPPYFYRPLSQDVLCQFLSTFLEKSTLPVLIYNQESNTQIPITYPVSNCLMEYENFLGIIDKGNDALYPHEVKRRFPNLLILSGNDQQHLQWLKLGCDAILSESANTYPWLFSGLFQSYQRNDMDKAIEWQELINGLMEIISRYPYIAALKYTLYLFGFPAMGVRLPLKSLTEDQKTKLKTAIGRYLSQTKILL
jgi:dihydrodipicolinate synthase/N-acetylneuraminate lyase